MYVRSGSLCMQSSVYCALNIGCSLTIDTAFSFSFLLSLITLALTATKTQHSYFFYSLQILLEWQ